MHIRDPQSITPIDIVKAGMYTRQAQLQGVELIWHIHEKGEGGLEMLKKKYHKRALREEFPVCDPTFEFRLSKSIVVKAHRVRTTPCHRWSAKHNNNKIMWGAWVWHEDMPSIPI